MSEHHFHIDYTFSQVLDLEFSTAPNVDELKGEIYYNDYSNSNVKAGIIELHLYNYAFMDFGFNLYDAFDRSMNTIKLGDAILDYRTGEIKEEITELIGESFGQNILVIHEFILFSDYRNKGYGKQIIKSIEEQFHGKCNYIALHSFPKQHDITIKNTQSFMDYGFENLEINYNTAQENLNEFYESCGYSKFVFNKSSFYIKCLETT